MTHRDVRAVTTEMTETSVIRRELVRTVTEAETATEVAAAIADGEIEIFIGAPSERRGLHSLLLGFGNSGLTARLSPTAADHLGRRLIALAARATAGGAP